MTEWTHLSYWRHRWLRRGYQAGCLCGWKARATSKQQALALAARHNKTGECWSPSAPRLPGDATQPGYRIVDGQIMYSAEWLND